MSSKQRKVLRKENLVRQAPVGDLVYREAREIALPPRTRSIIEKKLSNKASLMALANAEEQAINDLIEAAREMLGVPDSWTIKSTEAGFVAPAATAEPVVEVAPADEMAPMVPAPPSE